MIMIMPIHNNDQEEESSVKDPGALFAADGTMAITPKQRRSKPDDKDSFQIGFS